MKGYEVWGRIDEGCSEFLGLFTEFRKAEREAKQASKRYPLGADIDCCVIDVWGDGCGDYDTVGAFGRVARELVLVARAGRVAKVC